MRTVGSVKIIETMKKEGDPARKLVTRRTQSNWILVQASIVSAVLLTFVGPCPSNAQEKPLRIGVLALGPRFIPAWHCGQTDYRPGSDEPKQDTEPNYVLGLAEQLRKLNYVEERPENVGKPGRHFILTVRTGTSQQLKEFAREFVADRVDVIVGVATAAVRIAQEATHDDPLPVVMTGVSDPVEYGFIQSL